MPDDWSLGDLHGQQRVVRLLQNLRSLYEPEGVGIWLFAKQRQFYDWTALELIEAGRIDELEILLDQLITGAYS